MEFLTKAKLKFEYTDTKGVKWYSLKNNLIFNNDTDDLIIVPKDVFFTDLASVPKFLQWLYKPDGKYTRCAILHDFLYSNRHFKRAYCDYIFRCAMKLDKVSFKDRWVFWLAVRVGGRGHRD